VYLGDEIDTQDMRGVLQGMADQCDRALEMEIPADLPLDRKISNVVLTGMGGSALPGEILANILSLPVPFSINRGYALPHFAGRETLVFVISYSGNTEETLSAYRDAKERSCVVVGISHDGDLQKECQRSGSPFIKVPGPKVQPRFGYPLLTIPLVRVLTAFGLIPDKADEISDATRHIRSADLERNGKELASRLHGTIPLIYASEHLCSVPYKWKMDFNECSKVHAFSHLLPECNHNEIVGYTNALGPFYTIILLGEMEHERLILRAALTQRLIKEKGSEAEIIKVSGPNHIAEVLGGILLGDWTSYYLALSYGVDPTPVEIIEELKKELLKEAKS